MIIYKLLLLLNTERILFHQTFRLFDKDGDGYIGKDELLNTLRALGHEVTMNDMDDIMSEIQTHKKGVISFDEFCTIMKAPTMDTMKTLPTRRKSVVSPSYYPLSTKRNSLAPEFPPSTSRRHSLAEEAASKPSSQQSSTFSFKGLFSSKKNLVPTSPTSPLPISRSKSPTNGSRLNSDKLPPIKKGGNETPIQFSDQASAEDMRGVFDMFDLNKDGFLSVNEFKSVSSKLGIGIVMEDNEIRQLFNLVDTNKDGLISYDEFVRLFNIS